MSSDLVTTGILLLDKTNELNDFNPLHYPLKEMRNCSLKLFEMYCAVFLPPHAFPLCVFAQAAKGIEHRKKNMECFCIGHLYIKV